MKKNPGRKERRHKDIGGGEMFSPKKTSTLGVMQKLSKDKIRKHGDINRNDHHKMRTHDGMIYREMQKRIKEKSKPLK